MPTFTQDEITMLHDALNQAIASNKRMQTSKPKFAAIFTQIDHDLNALKIKVASSDKVALSDKVASSDKPNK